MYGTTKLVQGKCGATQWPMFTLHVHTTHLLKEILAVSQQI